MRDLVFIKIAKTPFFAKVMAWLLLLYGIGVCLMSGKVFLTGIADLSGWAMVLASVNLIIGIGLIVVSFGFRHLRRWALDIYTGVAIIALALVFFGTKEFNPFRTVGVVVEIIFLIYFWFVKDLFKPYR